MATQRICSIPDCGKTVRAKGLCQSHYRLQRLYGSTDRRQTPDGAALAFVEQALKIETDECIIWPYGRTKAGPYGRVGKNGCAHRMVCEATHGPPTFSDARACHSCGVSLCVNKRHIRWGTAQDNANDAIRMSELATGANRKNTKLTDEQVAEIYAIGHSKSISALVKEYGVGKNTISCIRAGRRACQRSPVAQ